MNDLIIKKAAVILIGSGFGEPIGMRGRVSVIKDGMISLAAHLPAAEMYRPV
jgi:hypothetical protein